MSEYENPWNFNDASFETELIGDKQGFVYLIESLVDGRMYIGKKNFWLPPKPVMKLDEKTGKKKRVKVKRESDWKNYWGSNKPLIADIATHGKDKFKRTILFLCDNKSQMSYLELREHIERKVLENDQYYNDWIIVRVTKKQIASAMASMSKYSGV